MSSAKARINFDFVDASSIAFENGDNRLLLRHGLEELRRNLGEALLTLRNDFHRR